MHPFVNEHMCVCVFQFLGGCAVTSLSGSMVSKKSSPHAHPRVPISILSPSPPATSVSDHRCVLLTFLAAGGQKPHIPRLCRPTAREKVNCCYYCYYINIYFFTFPFLCTITVLLYLTFEWPNTEVILKLYGLFRSAPDNQPTVTSTRLD